MTTDAFTTAARAAAERATGGRRYGRSDPPSLPVPGGRGITSQHRSQPTPSAWPCSTSSTADGWPPR